LALRWEYHEQEPIPVEEYKSEVEPPTSKETSLKKQFGILKKLSRSKSERAFKNHLERATTRYERVKILKCFGYSKEELAMVLRKNTFRSYTAHRKTSSDQQHYGVSGDFASVPMVNDNNAKAECPIKRQATTNSTTEFQATLSQSQWSKTTTLKPDVGQFVFVSNRIRSLLRLRCLAAHGFLLASINSLLDHFAAFILSRQLKLVSTVYVLSVLSSLQ
jgi:hypothetical protein